MQTKHLKVIIPDLVCFVDASNSPVFSVTESDKNLELFGEFTDHNDYVSFLNSDKNGHHNKLLFIYTTNITSEQKWSF